MQLRDYQSPVVDKASEILFSKGICLMAAECRCGKTLMALSSAVQIGSKGVLFITPKKAIPSIEADYGMMKKDNPYIFPIQVMNPEKVLAIYKNAEKTAMALTERNYPGVSKKGVKFKRLYTEEKNRQIDLQMPYMADGTVDLIIVDECHRMGAFPKPSGSQQVLRHLAADKRVLLLSGTPNPESHSMFYHEFAISDRSPWIKYGNFYAWAKAGYVEIEDKMVNGYKVPDYSHGVEEKILGDIRGYMVTLTQKEAGFSTKIVEDKIYVNMSHVVKNLITNLKRYRVVNISNIAMRRSDGKPMEYHPDTLAAETPADLLNKIHQLSGGTIKIGDEYFILDSSKADAIKEKCQGMHYCIFYTYKAERDLLVSTLGKESVTEDWQDFQADRSKVFIGQIRSVREGIRLDTAEFSIFYSMEYSYVSYQQGLNRIVSKERETPSLVYFMTSQCRIEQMILDCVNDKKDFTWATYNSR